MRRFAVANFTNTDIVLAGKKQNINVGRITLHLLH